MWRCESGPDLYGPLRRSASPCSLPGTPFGRRIPDLPTEFTRPEALILVPVSVGFAVVGALIISRHPRHRLGWLYIGSALAMATALFAFPYAWYGLVTAPGAVPGALGMAWVSAWVWTLGFSPVVTFGLLLYPDGKLPSRRWWPAAAISAARDRVPDAWQQRSRPARSPITRWRTIRWGSLAQVRPCMLLSRSPNPSY